MAKAFKWEAEAVRAIAFSQDAGIEAPTLWADLVGQRPSNSTNMINPTPHSTATGEWNGYVLAMIARPSRVEAHLTAIDLHPNAATPQPHMPNIPEALSRGQQALEFLIGRLECTRVAIHLPMSRFIANEAEGNDLLNDFLGVKALGPSYREAVLQFNVPKPSAAMPGATINRLCKYGVGVHQTMLFEVGPSGGLPVPKPIQKEAVYLHLDFNNKPFDLPVPKGAQELLGLASELCQEALAVSEKGRHAF